MTSSSSFAVLDRFVASLEYRIQEAIAQNTQQLPPTIRCRLQQGRLLVLSEDSQTAATASERDQRFQALVLAISTGLAETELPEGLLDAQGELPVRLYLRKRGTASPYAARSWGWKPADALSDLFDHASTSRAASHTANDETGTTGALVLVSSLESDEVGNHQTAQAAPFGKYWPARTTLASLKDRWHRFQTQYQDLPWRSVSGLAAAGLIIGVIGYGISRPCLVGSCDRRQTASDLSQAALIQLEGTLQPHTIGKAHADLQKAVRLVSAIPPWSSHYDSAQAELLRYRTQLADLEWVMAAQKNATEASEKGQNPPHPVPVWVEVHLLWQKAINNLQRVPEDSPVAAIAQQKLAEYEANHAAIGHRLTVEERAERHLNDAVTAGQEATAQVETATTLTDWLRAEQAWDRAVNALSRIPQGTLAYDEARSLLTDYRRQLVQTRTRVTFEKAGERAYQDALARAAEAQTAATENQWTLAVDHWSNAYAQMRQVPKNTLRYEAAQTQLATYEESLKQAENRLKQAVALETIEDDLAELCPLDEGICTYSLSRQQIELTLRDPYDSAIRQSISPPSTQGHLMQSNSVVEETHQLVQNIMFLGNRVQLPISIYDVNREFIARYQPEYGGFVKQ